jgi:hypothetical protein
MNKTDWAWWAGRDEEWMTVGPVSTRENAIAQARDDIGEGEGDFTIMEACMHAISLDAASILDNAYNDWADNGDLFSSEHNAPEPQGTKEEQKAAEIELQVLLDAWVDKHRHTFPTPNMFAATRNQEWISNTVDPDMLPGGHDNPRERY